MKHLWLRFWSDTPIFWKKVQGFAISVGVSALAVWQLNEQLGLELPIFIMNIVKYTLAVCATIAGTASFTTNDKTLTK
jgi:hypothetical protein